MGRYIHHRLTFFMFIFLLCAECSPSCNADMFGEKDFIAPGMPRFKKRDIGYFYGTLSVGTNLVDKMAPFLSGYSGISTTGVAAQAINSQLYPDSKFPRTFDIFAYAELSIGYLPASWRFIRLELSVMSRYTKVPFPGDSADGGIVNIPDATGQERSYNNIAMQSRQWRVLANIYLQYDIPRTRIGAFVGGGVGIGFINNLLVGDFYVESSQDSGNVNVAPDVTFDSSGYAPALTYEVAGGVVYNINQGFVVQLKLKYNFLHPAFASNAGSAVFDSSFDISGGVLIRF